MDWVRESIKEIEDSIYKSNMDNTRAMFKESMEQGEAIGLTKEELCYAVYDTYKDIPILRSLVKLWIAQYYKEKG